MKTKTQNIEMVDPKKVLTRMLKTFSGSSFGRELGYNLFYHIIGFKGVCSGVGCSTIVANTALALADFGLSVCVFDTSILHPCQDELLRTNYKEVAKDKRIDWLDMPFHTESPLNISKLNKNISVLSFAGKDRTILDMLGTLDSEEAVDIALHNLESKFDIILIDLCDEPSNIATTSMQKSQQVIQIWSDSIPCLTSIPLSIANNITLSCPKDKMRYVIENKTCDDTMLGLDSLYKEYKFKRLSHCGLSYEIARVAGLGHPLWNYPTMEATIGDFNLMILDVVTYLLDIDKSGLADGEIRKRRPTEEANERNESLNPVESLSSLFKKKPKGLSDENIETAGVVIETSNEDTTLSEADSETSTNEDTNTDTDDLFSQTVEVPVEEEQPKKKGLFGRRKK